ncbi:hypothetical protein E6H23_09335 [Candidatus Bathyarchaeota archaeon]|nr:MAG: hypothetical protein E6H23_09335 [Candidatus Bathyarchaeota archaeon]
MLTAHQYNSWKRGTLAKNAGGHCGCCTYLSILDPVLHSIIAEQGAKLGDGLHCKCCTYWRVKGIHRDISKARRISRPVKTITA